MNTLSETVQAAMVADLCERAAAKARKLDAPGAGEAARCTANLRDNDETEARYREGLKWLQVPEAAIDAAVIAIKAGRHPDDSLPGALLRYKGKAERESATTCDSERETRCDGEVYALGHVLSLIGCKGVL